MSSRTRTRILEKSASGRHLCLVGFSGSGKTTVGNQVAKKLHMPFVDIDSLIEARTQMPIANIFEEKGEKYFRKLEKDSISHTLRTAKSPLVISLGGGGFENLSSRGVLLRVACVVYLKSSVSTILMRLRRKVDRPILNLSPPERRLKVKSLLEKRRRNYERAHITVATANKTIGAVADEICRRYKRYDLTHL